MDPDLRRALGYAAPHWRRLALVLGLSLAGTLLALLLPYLSRALVDKALLGRDFAALLRIVGLFVAITLVSFGLNVVSGLLYTRVSADMLFDMRLGVYRHLQRLSPRFYARMPLGQIASRINSDVGEIQRVAAEVALAWLGNVIFFVGSVVILITLDPLLFFVSLALLPPAIWALIRYRAQLERSVAAVRDTSANVGSFLVETLQGMKLIVAANAQEREVERLRSRNDSFVSALMSMRRLTYLSGGLPGLVLGFGSAIVFLVGGWRVISGAITMGTLVAFVAYQMRLVSPIQALMALYTSIATARVSLKRVHEILDTPVEVDEEPDAIGLPSVRGDVTFEDVAFTHDRGDSVLDGVSLAVGAGERVAVVGRSGEGKSTIADLLIRHLDPQRGRILLDRNDIRHIRLAELRRWIAVVDQEPFVFHASIAENIRYARPNATASDVLNATHAAGLSDLLERLPEGLNTIVGERGRALSAGERQRVAIARALLADPAVLVLDEATSALDPQTEAHVLAGYDAIMRNRTTIIITHRLELARRADRIVVLQGGRIIEEGPPAVLYEQGTALAGVLALAP
ncbi:MAG TPA: ABC transporter ATP-binding protein [Gemmatimonadaceae bacterium]|nr:ABC transporter ATP-binding protein [Gemmatimonadaceae bacterium]